MHTLSDSKGTAPESSGHAECPFESGVVHQPSAIASLHVAPLNRWTRSASPPVCPSLHPVAGSGDVPRRRAKRVAERGVVGTRADAPA